MKKLLITRFILIVILGSILFVAIKMTIERDKCLKTSAHMENFCNQLHNEYEKYRYSTDKIIEAYKDTLRILRSKQ